MLLVFFNSVSVYSYKLALDVGTQDNIFFNVYVCLIAYSQWHGCKQNLREIRSNVRALS